jgi:hypothetical protein
MKFLSSVRLVIASLVTITTAISLDGSSNVKRSISSIQREYDYIVVGGGTSGLVVANRLSAKQNSKSLLTWLLILLLTVPLTSCR